MCHKFLNIFLKNTNSIIMPYRLIFKLYILLLYHYMSYNSLKINIFIFLKKKNFLLLLQYFNFNLYHTMFNRILKLFQNFLMLPQINISNKIVNPY